jgi:membrane-bound serine protease (ClpP class)
MNKQSWLLLLVLMCLILPAGAQAQEDTPTALLLNFDGPISATLHSYLQRGIRIAASSGAEIIILQLDTPGGEIELTNAIVQTIRASQTPIVVYVAPRGAIAGSAGTLITLAGHAAAMAPETAIGAASPISGTGEDLPETLETKQKNILKASARALAERRGERAVELAESTIETAEAASAEQALEAGLIDFIASDVYDLLRQLDGFRVELESGELVLDTAYLQVETLELSLIEQLGAFLANATVVFILLILGVQAILIEISSPGGWVAGFLGVVCLALAGYGLGVLPVNWFGAIFLVLAFVLFILDIKAPTHGALTAAGVGSLIVAGLVLFNSPGVPSFQRVSVPVVIGASLATGAIFFIILTFGLRAQSIPVLTGQESLVGRTGKARSDLDPSGAIHLAGEEWTAETEAGAEPISKGTDVEVVAVQGLKLIVRKSDQ